jgi:hypothetical protein
MHRFQFQLEIHTVQISPPREGDRWFMLAMEAAGFLPHQLEMINVFRQHQEVLVEFDVFSADGSKLHARYLSTCPSRAKWSNSSSLLSAPLLSTFDYGNRL